MSRDEYEGLSASFAEACRRADEKRRRKRVDPSIERARQLMDDDKVVSIEAAYATFDREQRKYGAAWSTVEALILELRERGTAALQEPKVLRRLSQLDDQQLRDVAVRLQKLRPHIAPAWKPGDIAVLFAVRGKIHGRKNP